MVQPKTVGGWGSEPSARHPMYAAETGFPIPACTCEETDSDVRECHPGHVIWKAAPSGSEARPA